MKRSEVDSKLKWRLEDIYADETLWEKEFNEAKALIAGFGAYDGKLNDETTVLDALKKYNSISHLIDRLYCYARMRFDEDGKVDKYTAMADRAYGIAVEFNSAASFLTPQLSKLSDEKLGAMAKKPQFGDYDFFISEIIRGKAHVLSDAEEKILALSQGALAAFQKVFGAIDNIEVPLGTIKDEKGNEQKLTHGSFSMFLHSQDRRVRRDAYNGVYTGYRKLIHTIAANYAGNVKKGVFIAKARGYNSPLEAALDGDGVPSAVYQSLIDGVERGLPALHKYVALRKRALKVDELYTYDMYMSLFKDADVTMPYDRAYKTVVEALAPLGKEYGSMLEQAYTGGWIDVVETEGKRSGAYSWGSYGTHPYVLLNYQQTAHDIFTIAHEMGHAMHTYYSNKTQPFSKAGYSIFVAEVASTVNEVLLLKHLQRTIKDEAVKKFLTQYFLDMVRTTIFRQTQFSCFEKTAHEMEFSGKPLTVESLGALYGGLVKKFYGDALVVDEHIACEWARIPHFYKAFYVYKYSTGLATAIALAKKILNGETDGYFEFLKSGGSDLPYNILKRAGVDLATSEPYDVVNAEFSEALAELEKLI